MSDKKTSHIGLGVAIGSLIGVAAGYFLQTKKGKAMIKDAEVHARKMQAMLMKQLKDAENLTKEKYERMVDDVVGYYSKTKHIAKTEVPDTKKYLMKKWSSIEKQLKTK